MRKSLSLLLTLLLAHCSVYDESLLPDGSSAAGGNGSGGAATGGNGASDGGTGNDTGNGGTGGSSGGTTGGGGTDSSGGGTTGGSGGTGNSSGGGGTDGSGGGSGGSEPEYTYEYSLISSMEGVEEMIDLSGGGYWFTAWDDVANEESCIEPHGAGEILPIGIPDAPRALPGMLPDESMFAMHFVTTGCEGWGAQAGFGLKVDLEDPDAEEGALAAFDASEYDGIAFWAKATEDSRLVRIDVADVATSPWGGQCVEGGAANKACHANYGLVRPISSEWQLVRVPFASMKQPSHGNPGENDYPDTSQLYQIVFSFSYNGNIGDIDVLIDDVYFYQRHLVED